MAKKIIIDDEFVLSKDKLSTHEAAAYLGMSWWVLTDGLRNNEFPFGTAKLGRTGTQYIYTIYSRKTLNVCDRCRLQRKKQAQRKWAIMQKRNEKR